MHSFKNWLLEETVNTYDDRKPHHIYHSESGHLIHVHLDKDEHGTHAVFINKHLGDNAVVKTVSWKPDAEQPSKDRKSTRLNSSHTDISRMPSSA